MFLKLMRLLNFIKKSNKSKTEKERFDLDMKKRWLDGEGPQTD